MKKNNENETFRKKSAEVPSAVKKGTEQSLLNSKIAKSNARLKRSNRSQHRGLMIIALLILLMIALIVVIIYKMPDQPKVLETEENSAIEIADFKEIMKFQSNEGSRYYPFANQFVYLSQEKLELIDSDGEVLFDENIEFSRPVAVYNHEIFIAGDRDSNQLLFLNHQNKKFSMQLDGSFAGAYFGGQQYVAIIEEHQDKPGFVHLVDLNTGKILLTVQFFESGYPLAVCFANDLSSFDVLLSNTSGSVLQPVLNRYDLSGKQIGQILPAGQPYLFGSICYDQNNNIILGGAANLVALNPETGEILAEFNAGRIYHLTSGPQITALVSNRIEGDITAINWEAKENHFIDQKVTLLNHIDEYADYNQFIALSQNNRIQILNQKSAEIILDTVVDARILRIGLLENLLILITENGIKTLSY